MRKLETALIPLQRKGSNDGTSPGNDGTANRSPAEITLPTRKLCTLAYVEEDLREDVHRHFPIRSPRAWAPCYSVDLIAVLRHIQSASRLAIIRDLLLSLLLLSDMVLISYACFSTPKFGFLVVLTVTVAVASIRLIMAQRKVSAGSVVRSIFRYAAKRTGPTVAVAAVLITLAFTQGGYRLCLLLTFGGLSTAWFIIVAFSAAAYVRASIVLTAKADIRELAKPRAASIEKRASETTTSNVLIYARDRAQGPLGPFVGAGHRLLRWTTPPVDITVPKDKEILPTPVNVVELHRKLAATARDLDLPTIEAEHRVYVDGRSIRSPLPTRLDDSTMLESVAETRKYQRCYLCIKAAEPDGDVVVTMFVRAMLQRELLQLEISVHALPEVTWPKRYDDRADQSPQVRSVVSVPPRKTLAVWCGVKAGTRAYWPILFGTVRRCAGVAIRPAVWSASAWNDRRKTSQHQFDFGAETSLREDLALNKRMHYNALVEMMAQAERLQHRLVKSVEQYLNACGIDAQEFAAQSVTIITTIQQNTFNDLKAGAMTFGNNSLATGSITTATPPSSSSGSQDRQ